MVTTTMDGAERRGLPRWMWWIMVFGVMLLVFYGAWRIGLKRAIARELAAIKAAGYPTTPVEMQTWYPPLAEGVPNAAEEILDAVARLKQPKDVFGEEEMDARPWYAAGLGRESPPAGNEPVMKQKMVLLPYIGAEMKEPKNDQPYPAESMVLVKQYLAANAEAMEKLEAAAKIEPSRYPADYGLGWNVTLPSLSGIRSACNLFTLAAIDAERRGDSEQATKAILGQLGIARSMRNEPVLITQLVREVCVAISARSLERAINRISFNTGQLARLDAALADAETGTGRRGMWVGECALFQEIFTHLADTRGIMGGTGGSPEMMFYSVLGLGDYSRLRYLQIMRRYREISGMAEEKQLGESKKLEAEVDAMIHRWMLKPLAMLTPSLSRVFVVGFRTTAQERCARAALGAERYRLERGDWPGGWGELVPGYLETEPIDPFTGKALMMKVADGVLTVYSVGEDLTDNGGARVDAKGNAYGAGADVVFEIGR